MLALPSACLPQAANNQEWRGKNDRGNRYEGYITAPVSSRFELVSFTALVEPYGASSNLTVRFYLPEALPATVVAREKQPRKFYWMESKAAAFSWKPLAWNEFTPWPTSAVLRDAVPPSNLGVVVYLGHTDCSSCRVAPAWVSESPALTSPSLYTVYVRPNASMEQVEWHLYALGSGAETEIASATLESKRGGVSFPIDLDATRIPKGPIRLYIRGHITADPKARPTLELTFWNQHPGA